PLGGGEGRLEAQPRRGVAAQVGGGAEQAGVAGDAVHGPGVLVVDLAAQYAAAQAVVLGGGHLHALRQRRVAHRRHAEGLGDDAADGGVEPLAGHALDHGAEDDDAEVAVDEAAPLPDQGRLEHVGQRGAAHAHVGEPASPRRQARAVQRQLLERHVAERGLLEPAGVGEEPGDLVAEADLARRQQVEEQRQAGDDLRERGQVVDGVRRDVLGGLVVGEATGGEDELASVAGGGVQHGAGGDPLGDGVLQERARGGCRVEGHGPNAITVRDGFQDRGSAAGPGWHLGDARPTLSATGAHRSNGPARPGVRPDPPHRGSRPTPYNAVARLARASRAMTVDAAMLTALTVLPFLGSALSSSLHTRARKAAAALAGLVSLSTLGLVIALYPRVSGGAVFKHEVTWLPSLGLNLSLRLDGVSWLFALLIAGIGALVVLYARYYMSAEDPVPRFFGLLQAFMGSMLLLVLSGNLIQLVFGWELTSLFSFLLIGYWYHNANARDGARMALLVTSLGGFCLLLGVIVLGSIAGSYDVDAVLAAAQEIRAHPYF